MPTDDFAPMLETFREPALGGLIVGHPPAVQGATLLSQKDDVSGDDLGLETARKLVARIAKMAPQDRSGH